MGQTTDTTPSDFDVKRFFQEVQNKLNKAKIKYPEIFKIGDEFDNYIKVISNETKAIVRKLKKCDPNKKEENNRKLHNLWKIDTSEQSEFKVITKDTLSKYLSYGNDSEDLKVTNSNMIQYNALALFIGYWGILDFKSENPVTLHGYLVKFIKPDLLEKIGIEVPYSYSHIEIEENDDINKKQNINEWKLFDTVPKKILVAIVAVIFITAVLWTANLLLLDEKPIPIFSSNDERFKILVLPFKNYNTGKEDVGSIIADRYKEINQTDSLNFVIEYWDLNIGGGFDIDSANYWKSFHNADFLIYGNYISHSDKIPKGEIKINYIADPWSINIKSKNKSFSSITLIELSRGALQGDIDYNIYYIAGFTDFLYFKYHSAIKKLHNVLDIRSTPEANALISRAYIAINDYKSSIKYMKRTLQLDSNFTGIYYNLGNAEAELGNYDNALKAYERALLEDYYYTPKIYNNIGAIYFLQEKYDQAIVMVKKSIERDIGDVRIYFNLTQSYFNLTQSYFKNGQFQEAKKTALEALKIDSTNIDITSLLGFIYIELQNTDSAILAYKKAKKYDSLEYLYNSNLASLYRQKKDTIKLIDHYKSNLRNNPNDTIAYLALRLFLTKKTFANNVKQFIESEIDIGLLNFSSLTYLSEFYNNSLTWKDLISFENSEKLVAIYEKMATIDSMKYGLFYSMGTIKYVELKDTNSSIHAFNRALEINPKDYMSLYWLGTIYTHLKDYKSVIKVLEKAVRIEPDSIDSFETLANAYFNLKSDALDTIQRRMKLISIYKQIITLDPNHIAAYINLGKQYFEIGKYQKAKDCYYNVYNIDTNYYNVLSSLGHTYYKIGNFEKSRHYYLKYLSKTPQDRSLDNQLGFLYSEIGEKQEAISFFKQAIEFDPNDYIPYANLAQIYLDKGNYELALENLLKVIYIDTSQYDILINLGVCFSNLDFIKKAITSYKRAIDLDSSRYESFHNLGLLYHQLGNYDSAIQMLLIRSKMKPKDYSSWIHLGNSYYGANFDNEAINCYNKAISLDSIKYHAWLNQGLVYQRMEKWEDVVYCFKKVIQNNPDSSWVWKDIGSSFSHLEKFELSKYYYKKAIELEPDYYHALFELGVVYFNLNEIDSSLFLLNKASQAKSLPEVFIKKGMCYIRKYDYKNAEEELKKAVNLGSSDFGNLYLGCIDMIKNNKQNAIQLYNLSFRNFKSKQLFWSEFDTHHEYFYQTKQLASEFKKVKEKIITDN